MTLTVVSLCSGAGGLDKGLEDAGLTVVAHCEIDPHARSVLARHWPDVACHDDITTFDGSQWRGRVDVVAGGTPCTDLSVAGRRAGLVGDESRLFWDFCRVADHSAADWVLWENVAGALSSHDGEDFSAVLWGLTGHRPAVPANGWSTVGVCQGPRRTAVWRLLDARWFGVAQRRRRVFVVAHPRTECAVPVLVESSCVPRGPRPGGTQGQDVAGTLGGGSGGRGWCPDTDRMTFVPTFQRVAHGDYRSSSSSTLRTHAGDGTSTDLVLAVSENQRGEVLLTPYARQLTTGGGKPGQGYPAVLSFGWQEQHHAGETRTEEVSALTTTKTQAVAYPLAMRGRDDGAELELGEPDIYNALRAGDGGSSRQNGVLTPQLAVRRLTPRECERLMGWPDDFTRWDADGRELADSHRYRMCGNGVVAPVAQWIGEQIMKAAAA